MSLAVADARAGVDGTRAGDHEVEPAQTSDEIEIDLSAGRLRNLRSGYETRLPPMAAESLKLIEDGGIAAYTRRVLAQRRNEKA